MTFQPTAPRLVSDWALITDETIARETAEGLIALGIRTRVEYGATEEEARPDAFEDGEAAALSARNRYREEFERTSNPATLRRAEGAARTLDAFAAMRREA